MGICNSNHKKVQHSAVLPDNNKNDRTLTQNDQPTKNEMDTTSIQWVKAHELKMKEVINHPARNELKRRLDQFLTRKTGHNDDQIYENIEFITDKETEYIEKINIKNVLKENFQLKNLTNFELDHIIDEQNYCKCDKGEYVYKKGVNRSCLFIIASGSVNTEIDGEVVNTLQTWDMFGEKALLYGTPRMESIKCNEETYFWALDRTTFQGCIKVISDNLLEENFEFMALGKCQLFEHLDTYSQVILYILKTFLHILLILFIFKLNRENTHII